MPKFSATIQFKKTRAQWIVSQVERDDGKGYTSYGITADDWHDAMTQAVALFHKGRKDADDADDDFALLLEGGEPELIILSQENGGCRVVAWPET